MRIRRAFQIVSALVLVAMAGAAGAASPGSAEHQDAQPAAAWDQAKVTGLASELASAVAGIRDAARKESPMSIGSGQSRSWHRLLDDLRIIESEAKHLARALAAGEGHDETLPVIERIDVLRDSAVEEGRRVFLSGFVLKKIEVARAVVEKLRPYYGLPPKTLDLQR